MNADAIKRLLALAQTNVAGEDVEIIRRAASASAQETWRQESDDSSDCDKLQSIAARIRDTEIRIRNPDVIR